MAKKQLEKETLMRVDLENRCQSLQEELGFNKSVFEEVSMRQLGRHPPQLLETTPSTGPPLGVCSSASCPLQLLTDSLSWVLFGRFCVSSFPLGWEEDSCSQNNAGLQIWSSHLHLRGHLASLGSLLTLVTRFPGRLSHRESHIKNVKLSWVQYRMSLVPA